MKTAAYLLVCAFVIISGPGCVSFTYYHPNTSTPPLVTEKDELQISGGISETEHYTSYTFDGYYQFDTNKYIGALICVGEDPNTSPSERATQHSSYYEVAYGQNKKLNKHFTGYWGPALGYGETFNSYEMAYKSLDYFKGSYRGYVNLHSKIFDVGFGLQSNLIQFNNIIDRGGQPAIGTEYENDLEELQFDPYCLSMQPSINLGVGFKNVKLNLQYSYEGFLIGGDRVKHDNEYIALRLSMLMPSN